MEFLAGKGRCCATRQTWQETKADLQDSDYPDPEHLSVKFCAWGAPLFLSFCEEKRGRGKRQIRYQHTHITVEGFRNTGANRKGKRKTSDYSKAAGPGLRRSSFPGAKKPRARIPRPFAFVWQPEPGVATDDSSLPA